MNICLIIDIEPKQPDGHQIKIQKVNRIINGKIDTDDIEDDPVYIMAVLCEALICLIHAAHHEGIKKDFKSVEDCINHIQKGFLDSTYKAGITKSKK